MRLLLAKMTLMANTAVQVRQTHITDRQVGLDEYQSCMLFQMLRYLPASSALSLSLTIFGKFRSWVGNIHIGS